ncbi:MAG: hypothetical protein IPO48_06700, partial [Saprospiraceae bacterium]|nr:hypothetical protein [Saprospiraceae bacterium]
MQILCYGTDEKDKESRRWVKFMINTSWSINNVWKPTDNRKPMWYCYIGMGEPLLAYNSTMESVALLTEPFGLDIHLSGSR